MTIISDLSHLKDSQLHEMILLCVDESYDDRFGDFEDPGRSAIEELWKRYEELKVASQDFSEI